MKDSEVPTVSVIGYTGSGNGRVHVGKSCLLSRFLSKTAYCEDQLSVISSSEFDGEVVGGEHWLYWGEINLHIGDIRPINLRLIEHCEFVDDHVFLPISVTIPYYKRCLLRELHVKSRKLAYVCKAQLCDETSFPCMYLPPGKVRISVFLFVYDITLSGAAAFQQACFLQHVIQELCSVNFPLVLATTKHDVEASSESLTHLEDSLSNVKKRWIKRYFAIVETSAKLNVNVQTPFQYAALLSCGMLPKLLHGRKSHVSMLDRHLKRLSFHNKNKARNALSQYNGFQNGLLKPGLNLSYFIDPTDSFRIAYAELQRKQQKQVPDGNTSMVDNRFQPHKRSVIPFSPYHIPVACAEYFQDVSTHGLGSPLSRQRCTQSPFDESVSTLPTPPPVLLPSPRNTGPFSPTSCPSFFKASTDQHRTQPYSPAPSQSLAAYPLVRIYVYGEPTTVHRIIQSLRAVCPLDQCRAKNGDLYRISILSASSCNTILEPDRAEPNEKFDNLANRSLCSVDGPFFMSGPPEPTIMLPKSDTSAFSVPSSCPNDENGTDGAGLCDSQTTQTSLPSTSTSESMPSNDVAELEASQSSGHSAAMHQLCLHLLVYSSLVELERHAIGRDVSACPYSVIAYHSSLVNNTENHNVVDSIYNGIVLSTHWKLPFLCWDHSTNPDVLSHLLSMVCGDATNKSSLSTEFPKLDWTAFGMKDIIPEVVKLLISQSNVKITATLNAMFIDSTALRAQPILCAIISFPYQSTTLTSLTAPVDQASSASDAHRLVFLPPNVTTPAVVKPKPTTFNLLGKMIVSTRFFYPHQLNQLLQEESSACPKPVSRILFIHYLTSMWSSVEHKLLDILNNLLPSLSHNLASGSEGLPFNIKAVLVVAIRESLDGSNGTFGVDAGYECLKQVAMRFHCSVRMLSDPSQSQCDGGIRVPPPLPSDLLSPSTKPQLLFLSASPSDGFEKVLYRLALEGDSSVWSPVLGSSVVFPQAARDSLYSSVPTLIDKPCDNSTRPLAPEFQPLTLPTQPLLNRNVNALNSPNHLNAWSHSNPSISRHIGQRTPRSNMVALPWLPLSPADALRLSISKSSNYLTHRAQFSHPSTVSNQPSVGQLQQPPAIQTSIVATSGPLPGGSVEEYYAELPKVAQHDSSAFEQRPRRPNRPKRPYPRTSSTNSVSSASPPPTPTSIHLASSSPPIFSVAHAAGDTPITKHSQVCASKQELEEPLLSTEPGVYAEVDDALVPDPTVPYPVHPTNSAPNFLSGSTFPQAPNYGPPQLPTTLPAPPTVQNMLTRPLPSITSRQSLGSTDCFNCSTHHPPTFHSQVSQPHGTSNGVHHHSSSPRRLRFMSGNALCCSTSICDAPALATQSSSSSAFESLVSVVRRPSYWFRKNRRQKS